MRLSALGVFEGGLFQGGDELGEVPVSDAAQLADLDAAELAGADQEVDLVPSDAEDLGHLLDGVRLQGTPPPLTRASSRGRTWMWVGTISSVAVCARLSSRLMDVSAADTRRRVRETRR